MTRRKFETLILQPYEDVSNFLEKKHVQRRASILLTSNSCCVKIGFSCIDFKYIGIDS
jgi:hypothetical protein